VATTLFVDVENFVYRVDILSDLKAAGFWRPRINAAVVYRRSYEACEAQADGLLLDAGI
jgi:hypothetical protein